MVLTRQSKQSTFVMRHRALMARNDAEIYYVGLGDQFDDDRRLVRVSDALPTDARDAQQAKCSPGHPKPMEGRRGPLARYLRLGASVIVWVQSFAKYTRRKVS
jgi:hypothetical protein